MKKFWLIACAMAFTFSAGAENITVRSFKHAGPFPVMKPFMVDEVNVNSKAYDASGILETQVSKDALKNAVTVSGDALPATDAEYALGLAAFSFENTSFTTASIKVEGLGSYKLLVDGKPAAGELKLSPSTHDVLIRYVSQSGKRESLKVTIETPSEGKIAVREDGKHFYGMKDVLLGTRFSGVEVSPDGKYMIVSYSTTMEGGRSSASSQIKDIATGKVVAEKAERASWMPVSNRYYYSHRTEKGTQLIVADPSTGAEEILVEDLPQGRFQISPTEDFLIYSMTQQGPKERESIYQILEPDDRQAGWRDRSYAAKYDIATGMMQQLTFGYHDSYVSDISMDGRYALVSVSQSRLTERPTTVGSLYLLDLSTLKAETLVDKDGFMGRAQFSPDGKQILLSGSPEAFGRIGMNVKPGQTPSLTQTELYIMDIATKSIRPMTKNFNPNINSVQWSTADGMIYFTAENLDLYSLYRMNPKNGKIDQIPVKEDLVNRFSIAANAPVMAYYGQGAMNSDRLYSLDLKSLRSELKEDLSAEILKDVELGECHEWNFKNSKGETVVGRYYLPPHFDPSKKYPMIVNYYGGCSPTSRNFESRYPHHAYAALGYVVYIVAVPSGATGNGQEWSARHVNTAGQGPAEDIIEGAQKFCKEHSFVNEKKVGIIGASYGGFMSQYIPTLTDFFATAISHAGISDHTSYWGFGYWGYSYSETSMANSYPWTRKDLFVDQSPLYRADKINTPILFVHGDADTNVPVNESIQMFTALKLLGKETAFVAVKDQNHHILEYQKRLDWQDTIWAWFAKYLQDDPTWWDSIYAPKSL